MDLKDRSDILYVLNKVVLNALKSKGILNEEGDWLYVIGKWYKGFLESKEDRFSLKFPCYSENIKDAAFEYIYFFDLLMKFLDLAPLDNFNETELFDVFSYSQDQDDYSRRKKNYTLEFRGNINGALIYGVDTVLPKDRFFPVFEKGTIRNNKEEIYEAFHLFKAIDSHELIRYPILIDPNRDVSLFISQTLSFKSSKLLTQALQSDKIKGDDLLDEILDELDSHNILRSLIYKYPYQNKINRIIINEFKPKGKQFELSFKSRLSYEEIKEFDLYLLNKEIATDSTKTALITSPIYEVVNTGHSIYLFNKLMELRESWREAGFNKYDTPYPVKWLICINKREDLDYWKIEFKKSFPVVTGKLLQVVNELIEMIYDLNWIGKFLPVLKCPLYILPSSNNNQRASTILYEFLSMKGYDIQYISQFESIHLTQNEIIVLDPFSKVTLSNLLQISRIQIRVITPDFLYYNYQPFFKYDVVKFQYEVLLGGLRAKLDPCYENNKQFWKEAKKGLLTEVISDLKHYYKKYKYKEVDEYSEQEMENYRDITVEEKTHDEVFDSIFEREEKSKGANFLMRVTTDRGTVIDLAPGSAVLMEEYGFLIKTIASSLGVNSRFLPFTEISKSIDKTLLSERLASMPPSARNWKSRLKYFHNSDKNLYSILKSRGLSITEKTFQTDYINNDELLPRENISLPRSKRDWEIVCHYLDILEVDEAWRYNKCKEDINRLKTAYSQIIQYLSDTANYGTNLDDEVVNNVAIIFEKATGIIENDSNRSKEARSIINTVTRQLELKRVSKINILHNE